MMNYEYKNCFKVLRIDSQNESSYAVALRSADVAKLNGELDIT